MPKRKYFKVQLTQEYIDSGYAWVSKDKLSTKTIYKALKCSDYVSVIYDVDCRWSVLYSDVKIVGKPIVLIIKAHETD